MQICTNMLHFCKDQNISLQKQKCNMLVRICIGTISNVMGTIQMYGNYFKCMESISNIMVTISNVMGTISNVNKIFKT